MQNPSLDDLVRRCSALLPEAGRVLIGVCGSPGSGKTTLATQVVKRLTASGIAAAGVPMDGFHLSDVVLADLGLLNVKGSPETFDSHGYLATLRRLRDDLENTVYAPGFERTLEQPIAAAVAVRPGVRVVVTEGNYLLDAAEPWPEARALTDEVWFVDLDDNRRRSRLVGRHVKHGKTRDEAQAWVDTVDEPNAQRVIARRDQADLVVAE